MITSPSASYPASRTSSFNAPFLSVSPNTVFVANTLYLSQIQVPYPVTITGIEWNNLGTVAGNVLAGIYSATGQLLAQTPSTAQAGTYVAQGAALTGGPITLQPGTYYLGVIPSSATATFSAYLSVAPSAQQAQGGFALPGSIAVPPNPGNQYVIAASTY